MKEKMKAFFDMRATWAVIGTMVAATVGEPWTTAVKFLSEAVMAVL